MYAVVTTIPDFLSVSANRSSKGLDILTVDPKQQRRGVGTKLVKWGTELADQMGVEASSSRSVQCFVLDEEVLTFYIIRRSSRPQSMDVISMSSKAFVLLRTARFRFLRNGRIGRLFGTLLCIDLLRRHRYRNFMDLRKAHKLGGLQSNRPKFDMSKGMA